MSAYLQLLRPPQWAKNVFVFAALAFASKATDPRADLLSLIAFITFCLASSAGYIVNDILDRHRDQHHPTKKNRPIASGIISLPTAGVMIAALLAIVAILCIAFLPTKFAIVIAAYLVLTVGYSIILKHLMLLDVITIAILFVLRAIGGAVAIEVTVSHWLLICTFMLCLFLGFGKRRCEIAIIANGEAIRGHRKTLEGYTPTLLTHLLSTSGGVAIITFLLYTLDPSGPFLERKQQLVYTLPLVVYGIYRYAMLIELGQATGPTDLIVHDRPSLANLMIWVILTLSLLYLPNLQL